MYNAEVLSKYPVVQHFPFGSLFSWEQDPNAAPATDSVHTANHPISQSAASNVPTARPLPHEGTKASWAPGGMLSTTAPWSKPPSAARPTRMPPTKAPRANSNPPGSAGQVPIPAAPPDGATKAPWADQGGLGRR